MFCPLCGNEPVSVQIRQTERQLISARHYCAPCDLFLLYRCETRSIEIEFGPEAWMNEERLIAEEVRQMFLVFDGGRAAAKTATERPALALVNR
ncbi:MAG TPA: hypothetical protein VN538_04000 [Clostridia bacterium]|nr:hypothetical protein [Clostridia bacterium]